MNITSGNAPWNLDAIARQAQSTTVDPRIAFLKKQETSVLCFVLSDLATPADLGMSASYFLIALDPRFERTAPEQLFDLIVAELRERVK